MEEKKNENEKEAVKQEVKKEAKTKQVKEKPEVKKEEKQKVVKKKETKEKTEVKSEPKIEKKQKDTNENEQIKSTESQKQEKVEENKKVTQEEKPKFEKVTQPMKKKGKKGIIVFLILILIIAGLVAAWFYIPEFRNLFNVNNEESFVSEEDKTLDEAQAWEKTYVKILTEEYDYENLKDVKVQLLTIDENEETPTLAVNYINSSKDSEKVLDIWQSDEKGQIVATADKYSVTDDVIKVLYDIEKESYNWYLYYKDNDKEAYGNLSRLLKEAKKVTQNGSEAKYNVFDYVISSNETLANTTKEEFEQKFIELDKDNLIKSWVNYEENNSKLDTLEILRKEYNRKRTAREVVADYAKEDVLDKVEELQKKAELAKTEVTVGNNTLKYGTYSAENYGASDIIVVITPDKICSYSGVAPDGSQKEVHAVGTYNFKYDQDDGYGEKVNTIELVLNDGTRAEFIVGNNTFNSQWLVFNFKNSSTILNENANLNSTLATESTTATNTTEEDLNNSANGIDIGKDEALKLAQKLFGTDADGKKVGYYYLAWVKDGDGNKYYAYRVSWLVDDSHYSFVDTVLISADGKSYKEIGTPEDFTEGQTVTKFDTEKSF